ncbi:MAG: ribonuclease HII [Nitrospirae bacterium]|nr:ribonuclease HII [Nitrospirota bacterium]
MSKKPKNTSSPLFLYDKKIRESYPLIAGIDEAGRGPLAGPVVAGAVIFPKDIFIEGVKDSKLLSEYRRKRLFHEIIYNALSVGIGIVDAPTIDRINILQATKLAMQSALKDLKQEPDIVLIDAVKLPDTKIPQKSIIKGESHSASIAAASIIAKVVRDDIMQKHHEEYPFYNFKEHKGYGTPKHIEVLQKHGPCPIHRKSFRKVSDMELPL